MVGDTLSGVKANGSNGERNGNLHRTHARERG